MDIPRGQAQAEVSQSDLNVAQNEMMIANNASNDPYAPDARLLNANTDAKRRHTAAVRNQTLALKNVSEVSNQLWYSTRSPEWYNATQENARKKIELDEHFVCSASIASASSHVGIDRLQMSGAMGTAAAKGRQDAVLPDGLTAEKHLGWREYSRRAPIITACTRDSTPPPPSARAMLWSCRMTRRGTWAASFD